MPQNKAIKIITGELKMKTKHDWENILETLEDKRWLTPPCNMPPHIAHKLDDEIYDVKVIIDEYDNNKTTVED